MKKIVRFKKLFYGFRSFYLVIIVLFLGEGVIMGGLGEKLKTIIYAEVDLARVVLEDNQESSREGIEELQGWLSEISLGIRNDGGVSVRGSEKEMRPGFIVMQGIIEMAISRALRWKIVKDVVVHITAPRMPTPLMIEHGKELWELDLENKMDFAAYRNLTLRQFMEAGGRVVAQYAFDAKEQLAGDEGLGYYEDYCRRYNSSLEDLPNIKVGMKDFPVKMTGAIYYVDEEVISIESMQVDQGDGINNHVWSIKFGKLGREREQEVKLWMEEEL